MRRHVRLPIFSTLLVKTYLRYAQRVTTTRVKFEPEDRLCTAPMETEFLVQHDHHEEIGRIRSDFCAFSEQVNFI